MRALVAELHPVRRLRPPWLRATIWIVGVALVSAVLILCRGEPAALATRLAQPGARLEAMAALASGLLSVLAAFHLSVPGHSSRWTAVALASGLLWLACGIVQGGSADANAGAAVTTGLHCFAFITGVSLALGLALFARLRRSQPLAPASLGVVAALGVAGIASSLLQFFHPATTGPVDIAAHIAAVAAVLGAGAWIGGRTLAK